MSKHKAERDSSPYSKRPRLSKSEGKSAAHRLEANINSWKDLQLLLAFTQDSGPEKRQQIRQFKSFLTSIGAAEDRDTGAARSKILLAYLQSQFQPQHKEKSGTTYFADLIQTWRFAAQSDNENLFSSIAGVLALFFQVTSSSLEFRDIGHQLCQTLLEDEQLQLFERGLSTNRFKEHVASPCLRLLTEVTSHDGGTAAGIIWRKRDATLKNLDVFIRMRKDPVGLAEHAKRIPSIRNTSLRYLFANLRLQSPAAKAGILSLAQGKLARSIFQDIKQDPPTIVFEILRTFKTYVLLDDKLPQHIKKNVFREGTLLCIASLHNYNETDVASEEQIEVRQAAHAFLLFTCTSDKAGILEATKSAQPQSFKLADESFPTAGWTSIMNATTPTNQIRHTSFKNRSVSLFLQGLRPYANVMDKDLIVAIFDAAPVLLAEYFEKKRSISFEPKLTATWLGYSMFLLSTIQLPLTDRFLEVLQRSGTTLAIPASTIIETILPTPLTHKSLTRCLNQQVDLIAFITLKILIAAFQKLQSLLHWLQNTDYQLPAAARHTIIELKAEFCARCPDMRHVIAGFRKCPKNSIVLREAYTQLVALYYSAVPQAALDAKFDVSIVLSNALLGKESESQGTKDGFSLLDAEHLQQIAHHSPDVRWLYKPGTVSLLCVLTYKWLIDDAENAYLSSFTTVLRYYAQSQTWKRKDLSWILLQSVSEENYLLESNEKLPSLDLLIYSLRDFPHSDDFYRLLDQCFQQCYRKSVMYFEAREAFKRKLPASPLEDSGCEVDLLFVAIADQWPYLVHAGTKSAVFEMIKWLVQYLDLMMHAERNRDLLSLIKDEIEKNTGHQDYRIALTSALSGEDRLDVSKLMLGLDEAEQGDASAVSFGKTSAPEVLLADQLIIEEPPNEDEDHRVLSRWSQGSIPELVLEGTLGDLMLCLSSLHADIRTQSLNALRRCRDMLKHSEWSAAVQVYMLTGELVETAEHFSSEERIPYVAGVFAASCCSVLVEPLHPLYSKVNKFLNRGPKWDVTKIPSYWVDKVLLHPPTEDDCCEAEMNWLFNFLIDGLRTPEDMDIYRRSNLFERLFALAASPSLPTACVKKILQLLYRCTYVGGSTTLITRYGLLEWVQSELVLNQNAVERSFLQSLARRALDTCDRERVNEWSGGNMARLLVNAEIKTQSE